MQSILSYIHNPRSLCLAILKKNARLFPDKLYLQLRYYFEMGKILHLRNPRTFNEKLQWLKLYNRKDIYTTMVDKLAVKKLVSLKLSEDYIIPTLGVWDKPEDIDFAALPDKFVLKTTHGGGNTGVIICKDKSLLNTAQTLSVLSASMRSDIYYGYREWPYKNVPRKIIAERYMENTANEPLNDYKFMCFNGKVICSFICSGRNTQNGLRVTFFDRNWKKMPFSRHYQSAEYEIPIPKTYSRMIEVAESLSKDIPFVRVDLYEIKGKIYFGELTFFPGSGFEEFTPEEWDYKLGNYLKLPI